jgi:hypothetical protein
LLWVVISEVKFMKQLLSGTALAAALAIAAPVWAQTPTTPTPAGTPSTTAPAPYTQSAPSTTSPTAPSTTMQTAPSATSQTAPYAQQAPARPTSPSASAPASSSTTEATTEPKARRHVVRHASHMRSMHRIRHAPLARRGSRAPSDSIANQLNRQELGRLSGSSMPAARQGYSQPGQPPSSSGR